jgi:hypothetical protein
MKTLRKLAFFFAAGLVFSAGLVAAQTITRSIQQSQDPTGIIGVSSVNDLYIGNSHLNVSGPVPVVSACGTFTNVGSDISGRVTITAGTPASCTLTFAKAWGTAPNCIVAAQGAIPATTFSWATTTTTLVLTTAAVNTVWDYICTSTS